MELSQRLRLARESAGFSNASEFARRIGVQPITVYRAESGDHTPRLDIAGRWAAETGVSLDWLVTGEGDAPLSATGS